MARKSAAREKYKEKLKAFLCDNYEDEELTSFMNRWEKRWTPGDGTNRTREEAVEEFLNYIFEEDRLYALFCVMTQFDKYRKTGYMEIMRAGARYAEVPVEIQKPQIQIKDDEKVEVSLEIEDTDENDIFFKDKLKAIIIGFGTDLYGRKNGSRCREDAEAVYRLLTEDWKVDKNNICLLPEKKDELVTRRMINTAINKMCKEAKEDECLLFYFSGYGMELNGISYLMLPGSFIHKTTVRNVIRVLDVNEAMRQCKAKVKIRIFDANCSGQRLEELNVGLSRKTKKADKIKCLGDRMSQKMTDEVMENGTNWITFAACDTNQKAYEDPKLGHGVFTYFLLKGLKEKAARRGNNRIYMEDLKVYTCQKVMETMEQAEIVQIPQYQCEINGNVLME